MERGWKVGRVDGETLEVEKGEMEGWVEGGMEREEG